MRRCLAGNGALLDALPCALLPVGRAGLCSSEPVLAEALLDALPDDLASTDREDPDPGADLISGWAGCLFGRSVVLLDNPQ